MNKNRSGIWFFIHTPCFGIITVWTVTATALAAKTSFEQVFFSKNNVTLGGIIKIIGLQRLAFTEPFELFFVSH